MTQKTENSLSCFYNQITLIKPNKITSYGSLITQKMAKVLTVPTLSLNNLLSLLLHFILKFPPLLLSSYTGLPAFPPTQQAQSHIKAFALALPGMLVPKNPPTQFPYLFLVLFQRSSSFQRQLRPLVRFQHKIYVAI